LLTADWTGSILYVHKLSKGKIMLKLNGRAVQVMEMDSVDVTDAPRFSDACVSDAVWVDTNERLTDAEIEALNDANIDLIGVIAYGTFL